MLFIAVRTGLEPATPCVTGMYSNQLNYRTFKNCSLAVAVSVRKDKGGFVICASIWLIFFEKIIVLCLLRGVEGVGKISLALIMREIVCAGWITDSVE